MYPVLMAADILAFNAHRVPVGRDQVQHIEMARDFAARFNHLYGEFFVLPEAAIEDSVATLPGLDGRKMSKSYDNTIPLFATPAELKKLIAGIKTDSRVPGEAKDTEGSALFQLYRAFASAADVDAMTAKFADGIGWGDAKQALFERIESEVAPMREKYQGLIARPGDIEDILRAGAAKARKIATPFVAELRRAVGLRDLREAPSTSGAAKAKVATPTFKQYRESNGQFHFKLLDADGKLLVQSRGFDSARDAGQLVSRLKSAAGQGLQHSLSAGLTLGEAPLGQLGEGVELNDVVATLAVFADDAG